MIGRGDGQAIDDRKNGSHAGRPADGESHTKGDGTQIAEPAGLGHEPHLAVQGRYLDDSRQEDTHDDNDHTGYLLNGGQVIEEKVAHDPSCRPEQSEHDRETKNKKEGRVQDVTGLTFAALLQILNGNTGNIRQVSGEQRKNAWR